MYTVLGGVFNEDSSRSTLVFVDVVSTLKNAVDVVNCHCAGVPNKALADVLETSPTSGETKWTLLGENGWRFEIRQQEIDSVMRYVK